MKGTSYLLYLDSSAQSMNAAQFAWSLAKRNNASLVAQQVVDSNSIWRFLCFDEAGFVGSGIYLEAREQISSVMHSIAGTLALAYTSQAEGLKISSQTFIDEGSSVAEIARRSYDHDLIIMGYKGNSTTERDFVERLSEACSCPILLVSGKNQQRSKLKVFFTSDTLLVSSIAALSIFAESLRLSLELHLQAIKKKMSLNADLINSRIHPYKRIKTCSIKDLLSEDSSSSLILIAKTALRAELINCLNEEEQAEQLQVSLDSDAQGTAYSKGKLAC